MEENNNVEQSETNVAIEQTGNNIVEEPTINNATGEASKKKGPVLIVVLIVLIALGVGGYFCYDKFIAKKPDANNKEKEEPKEDKEPAFTICGFKDSNNNPKPEKIPVVDDYITTCIREAGERGVNATGFYGCKDDDCTLTSRGGTTYYIQDGKDLVVFDFATAANFVINPKSELYKLKDRISEIITNEDNSDFMMIFVDGTDNLEGSQYGIGRFYDKDGKVLFDGKYIEYYLGFTKLSDKFIIRFTDKDGFNNSKAENKIYEYDYNMKLLNTYEYDDIYDLFGNAIVVKKDNAIKVYDYDNNEIVKVTDLSSNVAYGGTGDIPAGPDDDNIISIHILDKSVTKEQVSKDHPEIFANQVATEAEWEEVKDTAGYDYWINLSDKSVSFKNANICKWDSCISWDYYSNN